MSTRLILHTVFQLEEVLLKTDSGYPRDAEVNYPPWQTLGVPFALRPIGQLHLSRSGEDVPVISLVFFFRSLQ